jgi:hypothetical protein
MEKPTRARGALILGLIFLAEVFAWEACFASLFLWLHHLVWPPGGRRNRAWLAWLAGAAVGGCALVIGHILLNPSGLTQLRSAFTFRTRPSEVWQFTNWELAKLITARCQQLFTLPLCVVSLVWLAALTCSQAKRRLEPKHTLSLIFLATTVLDVAIFRQQAWIHDINLYYAAPFFPLASVGALSAAAAWLVRRRWKWKPAGIVVSVLMIIASGIWTAPWTMAGSSALLPPGSPESAPSLRALHDNSPGDAIAAYCEWPSPVALCYLDLTFLMLPDDASTWPESVHVQLGVERQPDVVLMSDHCAWPPEEVARVAGMRPWSRKPLGYNILLGRRVRTPE